MERQIYADYDEAGVWVYQAFRPKTVAVAVEKGTFGKGFGFDRWSWIKPSLGWMMQRSKYATKNRMTAIARIKLHHAGWLKILENAAPAHFDPILFSTEWEWQKCLADRPVRIQWDPDRDYWGRPVGRSAIQLGLSDWILKEYVEDYILKVEDCTALVLEIGAIARKKRSGDMPEGPKEKIYTVEQPLARQLGIQLA